MDLMNIARSGLRVGEAMATAAASNIANSNSLESVPAVIPATGVGAAATYPYQPVRAVATAEPGGGASVVLVEQTGEVDINSNLVDLEEAQNLYAANAAVVRADRRIQSSLDLLA